MEDPLEKAPGYLQAECGFLKYEPLWIHPRETE